MKTAMLVTFLLLAGCISVNVPDAAPAADSEPPAPGDDAEVITPRPTQPASSASTTTSPTQPPASQVPAPNATTSAEPVEPAQPRDWGTIEGKTIRPGIALDGGNCTSNFLFQENWTRFFIGSAGHCFSSTIDGGQNCNASDWDDLGSEVTLNTRGGGTATGRLAYISQASMTSRGETDELACRHNDFALIELSPQDLDQAHPAVIYFGGPVALDNWTLALDDDVYFFGHSALRTPSYPIINPPIDHELLSPMRIIFDGYYDDNWNFHWRGLVENTLDGDVRPDNGEPIPGDSGGLFLGPTGNALACLGGGARNLRHALEYMEAHEGWAPKLVTWGEFSPDGIESRQVAGVPVPP